MSPCALRRQGWLAAGVAAIVVVSACTNHAPPHAAPDDVGNGTATSVSGSVTSGPTHLPGDPDLVGTRASDADVEVVVPLSWSESDLVETTWSIRPESRGRYLVGFAEQDGELLYSAMDSGGTVLWRAKRPATCTGFAMSMAGATPVVVLTDAAVTSEPATFRPEHDRTGASDGPDARGRWRTTASAYAVATGERLWGPVPVPGTVQGPGLVFGSGAPASALGVAGPRIALDPVSGAIGADEAATPGLSVLGEFDGTVVTAVGGELTAVDAATGRSLWTATTSAEYPTVPADRTPVAGAILVADGNDDDAAVIGLATGEVLVDRTSDAAHEPLTDTWVWVQGRTVRGASSMHDEWSRDLPKRATVALAAMGLVYLKVDGSVRVLNAMNGADAIAYPTDSVHDPAATFAVPSLATVDAAGLFRVGGRYVLATVERPLA